MRLSSFCLAAISLIGVAGGCMSSAARGPSASAGRVGVFRFWQPVPETSPGVTLEGEVTVERDTVLVETTDGFCHYDAVRSSGTAVVYDCSGVTLRFDRHNPIDRASYALVTTVNVPIRTCVRYVTTTDGRRVCAQMATVMDSREVRRSGRLRLQRAG